MLAETWRINESQPLARSITIKESIKSWGGSRRRALNFNIGVICCQTWMPPFE